MNYEDRDMLGMYKANVDYGPGPHLMGAHTLIGDGVFNHEGEHLGDIKEIMLNTQTGRVAYAVMTVGGVFTIGEKLFAVPWSALTLDPAHKRFTMQLSKADFDRAPGFNSDHWPNMADQAWIDGVSTFYTPPPH